MAQSTSLFDDLKTSLGDAITYERDQQTKDLTELKVTDAPKPKRQPMPEAERKEKLERLGQKTVRGLLAKINRLLLEDSLTVEQRIELLRQADRFRKHLVKTPSQTPKKSIDVF